MVVVSLVLAAAFTAMIPTQRASRVNSLVAQTQQNSRIAMEIMARDIKMAGFGMTGAVGACTAAGAPAPLVPNDNNAGGTDTGPDSVSFVVPRTNTALAPFWRLRTQAQGPFTTIELEQVGSVNAMVAETLAVNSTVSIGGAVSGTVAAIDGPNDELTLTSQVGAPKIFPVGTQIFMLECITYQVIAPGDANVALCGGSSPCLVRGFDADRNCNTNPTSCVAIVDGIEDIQLRYACDGCDAAVNGGVPDGIPDDTSGSGAFDIADFVSDNAWNAAPMTPDKIRLVRVSIVARQTAAAGLDGVHRLIGVPGNVGGGVFMNAGAHAQEFRDVVTWVDVVACDGSQSRVLRESIPWRYRSSGLDGVVVATQISLQPGDPEDMLGDVKKYLRWRKRGTPFDRPCCGSVFRNPTAGQLTERADEVGTPPTAGRLIDAAGLKGFQVGGAEVSPMHANYIVNTGDATARDVALVIETVRERVFDRFGIDLQLEVQLLHQDSRREDS